VDRASKHSAGRRWFGLANRVGRLIETTVCRIESTAELNELESQFANALSGTDRTVVACVDCSHLQHLSDPILTKLLELMRSANPRLERSAIILPHAGTILRHQMERVLRAASNRDRRLCVDAAEAKAWLSSSLNRAEQTRLDAFLHESAEQGRESQKMPVQARSSQPPPDGRRKT
jgi:hypothetical protein